MDILFILAQILAVVAFALTTLSMQFKKKSSILGMQIASNVAYMLEYAFLGGISRRSYFHYWNDTQYYLLYIR